MSDAAEYTSVAVYRPGILVRSQNGGPCDTGKDIHLTMVTRSPAASCKDKVDLVQPDHSFGVTGSTSTHCYGVASVQTRRMHAYACHCRVISATLSFDGCTTASLAAFSQLCNLPIKVSTVSEPCSARARGRGE
jgi:hypothetical protein